VTGQPVPPTGPSLQAKKRAQSVLGKGYPWSVAIFRETRNGVRPISGAQNEATAMAFGGLRSSCVRPGAHSARHQDSHNDWTPCRMAWPFVSAGAHAPHSAKRSALRLRGGHRTPLVACAPSLSCAPPTQQEKRRYPHQTQESLKIRLSLCFQVSPRRSQRVTIQLLQLGHLGAALEGQDERVEHIVGLFAES